ncbi:MAG TPA: four helix bundle protein [Gemmatimonadaceae bacterium]|nr:four helix bundle protein [Gemmatimonadaceae bacterium]
MPYRDLNVLDAADRAADLVNKLIDRSPRGRILHVQQLRDAMQSIVANIAEAFGRESVLARNHSLDIARGESEEAIRHLRTNFQCERISGTDYWPIRNLLVTIVKMLSALVRR